MLKKIIFIITTVFFIVGMAGFSLAAEKGNERRGKLVYRNVYKSCFKRGEIESKGPIVHPDMKTMAQWERAFEKKKFEDFGCNEEWSKLTEKDLNDIFTYLYNHAADSPSPAKCK